MTALEWLDQKSAEGLLSRAILDLSSLGQNPEAFAFEREEREQRERIFQEAGKAVGGSAHSPEFRERSLEWLDDQLTRISGPLDERASVSRLVQLGALPSDIYELSIHHINPLWRLPWNDTTRALETCRSPDRVENFGPKLDAEITKLITFYGKWYDAKRWTDRFLFVVSGIREDGVFRVYQAWRLYPAIFEFDPDSRLSDLFERFVQRFGTDFKVDTFRGRFFRKLVLARPIKSAIDFKPLGGGRSGDDVYNNVIAKNDDHGAITELFYGSAINMSEYIRVLKKHTGGKL